jgi:flagellar M-ring protein FliF
MPEALDRLLARGPSAWTRLGRGPQLLLLALGVLGPALVLFGSQWLSEGQWVPLFASLPAEEGGAILGQLKASKTPYRIGGTGDQILVPADKVSEARLKLAMQGLPLGGGVGFEVFDRPSLGVSDFAQRLNYQRALQGELARTIGQLREVARARVHLVLPQPSLFADRDRPASASVFLKLGPGAQLGRDQVRGIVHLVASSVEGLSPDRVTLVDTGGRVLAMGGEAAAGSLSPRRLEIKTALEESLERGVQTLLDSALGAGQSICRVSAQVNFNQIERTEEKFDPSGVMRQKTRSTESSKGRSTGPGSPAAPPATPGDPATAPPAPSASVSQNDGTRESESVTYEVGRVTARTVTSPGEIQRLSVAVVLNTPGRTGAPADGKQGQERPRSPEEIEKIRKVVMTAVGFSESRGDSVTVAEMPFDTSALDRERALLDQPAPAGPKASARAIGRAAMVAAAVVGMIVLAVLGWLVLRGRSRARARAEVVLSLASEQETPAPRASSTAPPRPPVAAISRVPQPIVAEELLQLSREREDIREKALTLATAEPDATAQLLRAWLVKTNNTHALRGASDAA